MGVVAITYLFVTSPYWSSIPMVSVGLGINYIVITIYTCLLLRRLRETTTKLERMATHDSLTGLPNRVLLLERLGVAIEANRIAGRMIACVYFDLDGFKKVNDTWGHDAGDSLLQEVGRRSLGVIRDTDLLARLGGDEFAVVLGAIHDRTDVEVICRRIVEAIENIKTVDGHAINVSASVGCVIVANDAKNMRDGTTLNVSEESVVRQADECMYASKKSGPGQFTIAAHQAPVKEQAA
jgi:diguanylate cyclase (GGDEF)-like protein